jgi:hypothetical protein
MNNALTMIGCPRGPRGLTALGPQGWLICKVSSDQKCPLRHIESATVSWPTRSSLVSHSNSIGVALPISSLYSVPTFTRFLSSTLAVCAHAFSQVLALVMPLRWPQGWPRTAHRPRGTMRWLSSWVALLFIAALAAVVEAMTDARIAELRHATVDMFYHGFENYMNIAFPEDEVWVFPAISMT